MASGNDAKAVAMRFVEAMQAKDVEGAVALVAEGLVNHAAIPEAQGRAGLRSIFTKIHAAFPDIERKLEDVIVEGNKVVLRMTSTGTHKGLLDFVKIQLPATGRSFRSEEIHIVRVEGGLIVEHWAMRDTADMLRQLGLFTAPKAA
jgi:steroid delta-isomerase-like uncharacterized protein